MTIQDYQKSAQRTLPALPRGIDEDILHMELGIMTECGEVLDVFKKNIAYGKPFDWVNVGEEVADIAWYVANKATLNNIVLADVQVNRAYEQFFKKDADELLNDERGKMEMTIGLISSISMTSGGNTNSILNSPAVIMGALKAVCEVNGISFEEQLDKNIAKLKVRFPDKFDADRAINRDLKAERETLES